MTFKLENSYQALPGQCKSCGNSTRLPVMDMGWSEEFHGAIYLCMTCLEEMASVAGFSSEETVNKIKNSLQVSKRKVEELELEKSVSGDVLTALSPIVDKLRDSIRSEYKEKFSKDLASTVEQLTESAENERKLLLDDFESRLADACKLAVLDYQADEAKRIADLDAQSAAELAPESSGGGESEASESSSVQELGDIYSPDYPGAPLRKIRL